MEPNGDVVHPECAYGIIELDLPAIDFEALFNQHVRNLLRCHGPEDAVLSEFSDTHPQGAPHSTERTERGWIGTGRTEPNLTDLLLEAMAPLF